jgi:hypothetical protein
MRYLNFKPKGGKEEPPLQVFPNEIEKKRKEK